MATNDMSIFDKYGIREIMDITFTDLSSGQQVLFLDSLKTSNITNKVATTYATGGKGNPQLMAWDGSRTAQLAIQDAMVSQQSLGVLSGNDVVFGSASVLNRDTITVGADGTATLNYIPASGSVVNVYLMNDSGTLGDPITSTVSGTTVTITAAPAPAQGTQVIAYYQRSIVSATTVTISSDAFPGYYQVDGIGLGRDDATGLDYPLAINIPKAKLQGNFNLTFAPDGNPTVLDFTMDVLKSSTSTDLINIIRWNEADQT